MRHPATLYLACLFNTLFKMMRALGILIWLFLIPSFCIAQEDIADKKSSLVIGGDLHWNSKYKLNEGRGFRRINISLNGKLGYFISENDLLLLRPRITGEFTSYKQFIGGFLETHYLEGYFQEVIGRDSMLPIMFLVNLRTIKKYTVVLSLGTYTS